MTYPNFERTFKALTGNKPFPWQKALYQHFASGNLPALCNISTGLGKTSLVAVWLIALAHDPDKVPRHLVYVVNRRTVVDQTTDEVEKYRCNLQVAGLDGKLRELCAIDLQNHDSPLAVSTLRGQFADNREWSADPCRPAVIVGTVDMIGSRLLFCGDGCGFIEAALIDMCYTVSWGYITTIDKRWTHSSRGWPARPYLDLRAYTRRARRRTAVIIPCPLLSGRDSATIQGVWIARRIKAMLRIVIGLLIGLLSITALAHGVPKPEPRPPGESPAEKTRKALEQVHSVNLEGLTLTAAVHALSEMTKVQLLLDRTAVTNRGIEPDEQPVTLKLSNVKLRSILLALCGQFNLSFVIEQDLIVLTDEPTAVERQVRQRVSVDFDQVPLDKALRQLGRETACNLVLDPRQAAKAKEPISLTLEDVPLEVAVRLMAELVGLRSVRLANVLFVTTKENAAELRAEEPAGSAVPPFRPGIIFD